MLQSGGGGGRGTLMIIEPTKILQLNQNTRSTCTCI